MRKVDSSRRIKGKAKILQRLGRFRRLIMTWAKRDELSWTDLEAIRILVGIISDISMHP